MTRNIPSVSEPQVTGETCAEMRSHQTRLPGETAARRSHQGRAQCSHVGENLHKTEACLPHPTLRAAFLNRFSGKKLSHIHTRGQAPECMLRCEILRVVEFP